MKKKLKFMAKWLGILAVTAFLIITGLFIWLRTALPSLRFLNPYIQEALSRFEPEYRVEYGDIRFAWAVHQIRPGVEMKNITVFRQGRGKLAECPRALLILSLGNLLQSRIMPVSLEIFRPEIHLPPAAPREPQTEKASEPPTGPAMPSQTASFQKRITDNLSAMAALAGQYPSFKQVRIEVAAIWLPDTPAPVPLRISGVTVKIRHKKEGTVFTAETAYILNQQTTRIRARLNCPPDGPPSELTVQAENLFPSTLARIAPPLGFLRETHLPVRGSFHASFSRSGHIEADQIDLTAGRGTFWHPHVWKQPLSVRNIAVRAALTDNLDRLNLKSLLLDFGGPVFSGSGHMKTLGKGLELALDIRADRLKIHEAHLYWPYRLAGPARRWIQHHFSAGEVNGATLKLRFRPEDFEKEILPEETIEARVPFEQVLLDYHPPLSELRDARGVAQFTAHDIDIEAHGGTVCHSQVESGRVYISGLARHRPRIEIQARVQGPPDDLRAAVDTLTRIPSPSVRITKGHAKTRLTFEFPLYDFEPGKFRYTAAADIRNMDIPDFHGFGISQKQLSVKLDNEAIEVSGTGGSVRNPKALEKPISIREIRAKGRLLYSPPGVIVESLSSDLGGPVITASGHVKHYSGFPDIRLTVRADQVDLKQAPDYWPRQLATPARQWVQTHLLSGKISGAEVRVNLIPDDFKQQKLPRTAVRASVPFENVTLDYFPPLPRLVRAGGTATFSAESVRVAAQTGECLGSRLENGTAHITGLDTGSPAIEISAKVRGPVADLLRVEKEVGGGYTGPSLENGTAVTHLSFAFPLKSDIPAHAFRFSAASDIEGIILPDVCGVRLTEGRLKARLENQRFEGEGSIRAGRIPLDVTLGTAYSDTRKKADEIRISAPLNAAHLSDLGLPSLPFLRGDAQARATVSISPRSAAVEATADLSDMAVDLSRFGWIKPAGKKATLKVRADITDARSVRFSDLRLYGDDFDFRGSGQTEADPVWLSDFSFDRMRFGQSDLQLFWTLGKDKEHKIEIRGEQFDAVPLLSGLAPGPKRATSPPEAEDSAEEKKRGRDRGFNGTVVADLGGILLSDGKKLAGVSARTRWRDSRLIAATCDGKLSQKEQVRLSLRSSEGKNSLIFQSDNAGAFLTGLNISPYVQGGALELNVGSEGGIPSDGPADGNFTIRKFTLKNTPRLMQILSAASFVGLLEQLNSGGIDFDILQTDFSYDKKILSIKDGHMEGLSLGISSEGQYDMNKGTVQFKGMVVPLNIINKILDAIPVLGKLITGKGIIATNYTLEGPYDAPEVSIQPLSTLAIGPLKEVFKHFKLRKQPDNKSRKTYNRQEADIK